MSENFLFFLKIFTSNSRIPKSISKFCQEELRTEEIFFIASSKIFHYYIYEIVLY